MARIALVMHAPLGAAFSVCAGHILGRTPELTVFDVAPEAQPEEVVEQFTRWMLASPQETVLILCDIFGATPFNIARKGLKKAQDRGASGHLLTGTNLCMVLKALTDQHKNPEQFSESVRLGALKGIMNAH